MSSLDRRAALLFPAGWLAVRSLARAQSQEPRADTVVRLAPRTVILLRHAEKSAEGDPKDPELSAEGKARADELVHVLAHAGITRLVASEFRRTQQTLVPLATKLRINVDMRAAGGVDALATELVSAQPGSVTAVAGHTNTLPALAARLGVLLPGTSDTPQGPQLGEGDYDRLFVLSLPPSDAPVKPTVLELRYGK